MIETVDRPQLDQKTSRYRVYVVGRHGLYIRTVEIDCPGDNAAIESAKTLLDDHDVEVWQGDRPVARLDVVSKKIMRK
jgi:hypothetical protein